MAEVSMSKQTAIHWGPALSVVLIAVIGILSGADALFLGSLAVILAALLVIVSYVRSWTMFAWLPLVGFAVLTVGHVIGDDQVSFVGAFLTLVMFAGHSILELRRKKHTQLATH